MNSTDFELLLMEYESEVARTPSRNRRAKLDTILEIRLRLRRLVSEEHQTPRPALPDRERRPKKDG